MTLDTKVENLTRVGKTTASRLQRLGIATARDLLFHFPHRYEDWSQTVKIAQIKPFQNISLEGQVASIRNFKSSRRRMNITEAVIEDETGSIKVIWFNQPFLIKNLPAGTKVSLAGKAEVQGREVLLKSPKYEIVSAEVPEKMVTDGIVPIYPLGMNISQKQMQFLANHVLPLAGGLFDPLPQLIRDRMNFPELSVALRWIHRPENLGQVEKAKRRFAFEEVFYLQVQSSVFRDLNERHYAHPLTFHEDEIKEFVKGLPYELTGDQRKTAWKIFLDLQEEKPMNRLVQGDVGSGKTVVAAMSMYNTCLNGFQSVLMAPTEVLAGQHFKNFADLFTDYELPVAILTRTQQTLALKGRKSDMPKKKLIEMVGQGQVAMLIGTHALLQPDVQFRRLGLAVVDEQHRFGVEQRKKVRQQGGDERFMPHLLSMTATPIPRTLSLVFYGDLAISSIREKPKNRQPILTKVVTEGARPKAYAFIADEIKKGHQVYVVCPLIEESDKLGVASVSEELARIKKVFPGIPVAMLHGKLKADEKDAIMADFKEGKTSILVATTVIEVGVDVPNATIMVIEGAERFGLSQLHQIRGRVGRSEKKSYCFLFPSEGAPEAIGRLNRFIKCHDGFEVSELDLQMRGSGELLGTRQSGEAEFRFVDMSDTPFIEEVSEIAKTFLADHKLGDFPLLKQHIDSLNAKVHLE